MRSPTRPKSPGTPDFPPPPPLGGGSGGRRPPHQQRTPKKQTSTSSSAHRPLSQYHQQQPGGRDASSSGGGTAHLAFQVHSDASTTSTMHQGIDMYVYVDTVTRYTEYAMKAIRSNPPKTLTDVHQNKTKQGCPHPWRSWWRTRAAS